MRVSRPNNLNDVECPLHGFQVVAIFTLTRIAAC